jgi:serine/threonine protein phosphatase PrpC
LKGLPEKKRFAGTREVHPTGRGLSNVLHHNDSHAILSKQDKALPLSFCHKPTNGVKLRRMEGSFWDGRVDGNLAVSRSFGDFGYKPNSYNGQKNHRVTVYPDILVHTREPLKDEFLV